MLPVCRCFSLTHSLLSFSPPFPTTCSVSDRVYSLWSEDNIWSPTHIRLPARLPCCTSDSCDSQCCSLLQGKCQTQEAVFKYLNIQRFFSCNNFFYLHRSTSQQLLSSAKTNPGSAQPSVCVFARTLLRTADVSSGLMTTGTAERCAADV